MSSQPSQVGLIRQGIKGMAVPERGDGVSEEARLQAALTGVYECELRQESRYDFNGVLSYSKELDSRSQALPDPACDSTEFRAVEDVDGEERTLLIERLNDGFSMESLEVIPMGSNKEPLDYCLLESSASRRRVRYWIDGQPATLVFRSSGIDLVEVSSIELRVRCSGMPDERFANPMIPLVSRTEPFRIDLLHTHRADEARGLEELIQVAIDRIYGAPSGRSIRLECSYWHEASGSFLISKLPILLTTPTTNTQGLLHEASSALRSWCRTHRLRKGVFVIDMTIFLDASSGSLPLIKMDQLLLPMDSIADLA